MGRVHEVSVKGEPEVWKFNGEHTAESGEGVFRLLDSLDQVVCTVLLDRLEWHRSTSPDEIANTKAAGSVPYSPGVQIMEGFKAPSSD